MHKSHQRVESTTSDFTVGVAIRPNPKVPAGTEPSCTPRRLHVSGGCSNWAVVLLSGKAGGGGKCKGNGGCFYRGCWIQERQRWSTASDVTKKKSKYKKKNFLFTGTCSAPTHFFSVTSLQFFLTPSPSSFSCAY